MSSLSRSAAHLPALCGKGVEDERKEKRPALSALNGVIPSPALPKVRISLHKGYERVPEQIADCMLNKNSVGQAAFPLPSGAENAAPSFPALWARTVPLTAFFIELLVVLFRFPERGRRNDLGDDKPAPVLCGRLEPVT
jgi:hypothetical protein